MDNSLKDKGPSKPVDISDETFNDEVMLSDMPVVLEFWSPECGHCKKMAKVVDKLAAELAGRYKVAKVNILENAASPVIFGVSGVPAFFLIFDGKVKARTMGAIPKGRLKKDLGIHSHGG
ncbi:MAG: thioredoxin domain-containing protein [Nitrospirota bacterium]